MSAGDVYKLRIHQRLFGGEVINVLHFREASSHVSANASQILADDFRTSQDTVLRARASGQMFYEYVEVERILPYGDGPATSLWAANTTGTASGTVHPHPAAAEVVTIYTGSIGRAHRGRLFLAGALANSQASGLWTSAQTTLTRNLINSIYARYVTDEGLTGWRWGVWSRSIGGQTPPFDPAGFTPATGFAIRSQIRSQRRRNVGIGR